MKTTLNIKGSLLAQARALAAQEEITLTYLIEESLQLRLRTPRPFRKSKIHVYKGEGGLVLGLNPLSNKTMLDTIEDCD